MTDLKKELISYDLSYSDVKKILKNKLPLISDSFYEYIELKLKTDVFTVTGLTVIQEIKNVQNALAKAVDIGQTFKEWQDSIDESVLEQFSASPETVFITNTQTAYNEAAMERALETIDEYPYFMYTAVNDARVRDEHFEFDGFIAKIDDPVWELIGPPNPMPDGSGVFNCRCTRVQLTNQEAADRGVSEALEIKDNSQDLDSYYKEQLNEDLSPETKALGLKYLQDIK